MGDGDRRARLSAALRQNLRKRKAQASGRAGARADRELPAESGADDREPGTGGEAPAEEGGER